MPVGSTVWRILTRLDDTLLGTVLASWLRTRTPVKVTSPGRYRTVIAIDRRTLRGARGGGGRQVHLLSALDTTTGIVLRTRPPPTRDCKTALSRIRSVTPTRPTKPRSTDNSDSA